MTMPMHSQDEKLMQSALAMARRGLGQTGANPSVGCLVVQETAKPRPSENDSAAGSPDESTDDKTKDDKAKECRTYEIIARAVTGNGGTPHAEPQALAKAGKDAKGATLYVTLEPCNHHGKTPPCTEAIIKAGIKRVVIAATDKNPKVAGSGIARLEAAGITVSTGVCEQAARAGLAGHFKVQTEGRPHTIVKMAISQDQLILPGKREGEDKGPVWVTNHLARRRAALIRAEVDAILVGTQTALIDDPALTCRLEGLLTRSPRPIILDKDLKLPETLQLFSNMNERQPIIVHAADSSPEKQEKIAQYNTRNADLLPVGLTKTGQLDLAELGQNLAKRGITRLLVEGGPTVAKSYLQMGLADELLIFQGGFNVGSQGALPFGTETLDWALSQGPFTLNNRLKLGDNTMCRYQRSQP